MGGRGRSRANFYDPKGRPLPDAPPPLRARPLPVEALVREHRLRGIHPDWHTSQGLWSRDRDIPRQVLEHALAALAGPGSS